MANIKDLAKATGYSLATISRVFNGSDLVTEKTRKIVLDAAKELNYQPNKMAVALRSGKSKTIGLIVPEIDRPFFSATIKSMEEQLSKEGYVSIIAQTHESFEKEKEVLTTMRQLQVGGIIISISKETYNFDHIEALKAAGVTVVLFDRVADVQGIDAVVFDDFNGAQKATMHLIEQGCQRLIHLAGKEGVPTFDERRKGFESALKIQNLPFDEKNVLYEQDNCWKAPLKQAFEGDLHPDGIFAHGDQAAFEAIKVLRDMGLSIPQEVAVIGFGDSPFSSYIQPQISTINQRNGEMGTMAARTMVKALKKEEWSPSEQILSPQLIVRTSSLRST